MVEVGDLLAPCATLSAVTLAVFVFALPRALDIGKKRKAALIEADVPDQVKKQVLFNLFVFGDGLLLFIAGLLSLYLGTGFIISMHHILKLSLDSPVVTADRILEEFDSLLLMLLIVLVVLVVGSLALFTTEVIIGEKKLPLLARVYARGVLGRRPSKVDADNLVPEARNLYRKGAFGESVLYSMAALELALRDKLDLHEGVGFRRLFVSVVERLGDVLSAEELFNIGRLRNIAAHPSPETKVVKQDAEQALRLVEDILRKLQVNLPEGGN